MQAIKERGVKAGVTLNPATSLHTVEEILPDVDLLLVMSVNPGFGGQTFIESCLQKVSTARRMLDGIGSRALLEVDGGVKVDNAARILAAGAEVFVAGSAIFCGNGLCGDDRCAARGWTACLRPSIGHRVDISSLIDSLHPLEIKVLTAFGTNPSGLVLYTDQLAKATNLEASQLSMAIEWLIAKSLLTIDKETVTPVVSLTPVGERYHGKEPRSRKCWRRRGVQQEPAAG